jgi:hypothetical protein
LREALAALKRTRSPAEMLPRQEKEQAQGQEPEA